ncbi:MAG: dephospho-CoA kinase [Solirubrobacterales bacterium]
MPGPSLIGLTGGVAAGKSEALRILDELGAETVSTDALVHELLGTAEVRGLLVERWGERVAPGGRIDRAKVGEVVFADSDELEWLEGVLHPRVGERVIDWRRSLPDDLGVGVVEVPLLFEGRMAELFDATICVTAEDELRRDRAEDRGTDQLGGREGRQLSQAEKAERATFVVENDGSVEDLGMRLERLLPKLEAAGA